MRGAGAAMVLPLSLTLVTAVFPARTRGKAMGLYPGLTGLATFSGRFIGGAIAEGLAWQWIFWLNLPAVVGVLIGLAMPSKRSAEVVRAEVPTGYDRG